MRFSFFSLSQRLIFFISTKNSKSRTLRRHCIIHQKISLLRFNLSGNILKTTRDYNWSFVVNICGKVILKLVLSRSMSVVKSNMSSVDSDTVVTSLISGEERDELYPLNIHISYLTIVIMTHPCLITFYIIIFTSLICNG